MTIHEFADAIHWTWFLWLIGLLNPVAFLPQLYIIVTEKKVDGVSIPMFCLFVVIQLGFLFEGALKDSVQMMVSMGISACLSATIIASTVYLRRQ